MRVFVCKWSKDEMCSDSYKVIETEIDGIQGDEDNLMIVQAKFETKKEGGDVDIGAGNAFGGGGDSDGPAEDEGVTVINIVDAHTL